MYDEYSKRALGVSTLLSVRAQYKHLGMYTWSRVLAAIGKKCHPKVLVARQVVWLDAACYRPHTLIWWRRLWIWLRHSSIGIATHWHTWALLHTFRIFFVNSILTLWFQQFLVMQKCPLKPSRFQQNLIGFQTHFPPFVGLCPKFRFEGSEFQREFRKSIIADVDWR